MSTVSISFHISALLIDANSPLSGKLLGAQRPPEGNNPTKSKGKKAHRQSAGVLAYKRGDALAISPPFHHGDWLWDACTYECCPAWHDLLHTCRVGRCELLPFVYVEVFGDGLWRLRPVMCGGFFSLSCGALVCMCFAEERFENSAKAYRTLRNRNAQAGWPQHMFFRASTFAALL